MRAWLSRLLLVLASILLVASVANAAAVQPEYASGINGSDYSVNPPSLSGLTLLTTIPAAGGHRLGYLIVVSSSVAYYVTLDDGTDTGTNCTPGKCTILPLGLNGIGSWMDMAGMPHTGRIRVFGTAGSFVGAHSW
ncbi:MAG TPA: hypothetical protein VFA12_20270 [Stellaceae bacterium]|nr:hypothetical protein [Stellaceae bacterium]